MNEDIILLTDFNFGKIWQAGNKSHNRFPLILRQFKELDKDILAAIIQPVKHIIRIIVAIVG
jgi:hypothetical protein